MTQHRKLLDSVLQGDSGLGSYCVACRHQKTLGWAEGRSSAFPKDSEAEALWGLDPPVSLEQVGSRSPWPC